MVCIKCKKHWDIRQFKDCPFCAIVAFHKKWNRFHVINGGKKAS